MEQDRSSGGQQASGDPDERGFTGHPDHPPHEPDQDRGANEELLRDGGGQKRPGTSKDEGGSPGEATTLPGYGG